MKKKHFKFKKVKDCGTTIIKIGAVKATTCLKNNM